MGRRRGLLRHPRRSQRLLIRQSIPSEQARGGSLANGRRPDLRVPSHAPAAARCGRCDHRSARRHRHHPRSPGRRPASARLRRHQPAPPDLRQRRPPRGHRQRRRPAAQLGRRPQPLQAEARRDVGRARHHRSTSIGDETVSDVAMRARRRRPPDVVGARQGPPRPAQRAAPAARATAWSTSPRCPSCSTRPAPRWPPRWPGCATCTPATSPASCGRCRSPSASSWPRRWTTSGSPTCSRSCPRPSSCGSSKGSTSSACVNVLEEMEYDDLADLLAEMPGEQRTRILEAMDAEDADSCAAC